MSSVLHKNDRSFSSENLIMHKVQEGLPWCLSGTESVCNVGDRFDPWVGKIPQRREWQHTPVFLSGEIHGQRSLAGYSPWGLQRVQHNSATKQQQSKVQEGKHLGMRLESSEMVKL